MRAVCLQHVPSEGPGVFAKHLANRGVQVECYLVPDKGLPRDSGDLLIIMGGPMSVNDSDPWIGEETAFIKTAMGSGKPVLGVCLGSQFMAKALRATVGPGIDIEVGMTRVQLSEEGKRDPVFSMWPKTFEVLEWHGEVFDLPEGAVHPASSELCRVQAFRFRSHAYGLLFHLEMERGGIETLCRECTGDVARANITAGELMERAAPHLLRLHDWSGHLLDHLIDHAR